MRKRLLQAQENKSKTKNQRQWEAFDFHDSNIYFYFSYVQTTILDFTGVYSFQPFMQGLKGDSRLVSATSNAEILYIDCADISGTDCYCDDEAVETIRKRIADAGIKDASGIHFFDNGNYHYMSKIWTDMVQEPFSLVVFDHHPDMQAPRFGNILLSW